MPALNKDLCQWSATVGALIEDLHRLQRALADPFSPPPAGDGRDECQIDLFSHLSPSDTLDGILKRLATLSSLIEQQLEEGAPAPALPFFQWATAVLHQAHLQGLKQSDLVDLAGAPGLSVEALRAAVTANTETEQRKELCRE